MASMVAVTALLAPKLTKGILQPRSQLAATPRETDGFRSLRRVDKIGGMRAEIPAKLMENELMDCLAKLLGKLMLEFYSERKFERRILVWLTSCRLEGSCCENVCFVGRVSLLLTHSLTHSLTLSLLSHAEEPIAIHSATLPLLDIAALFSQHRTQRCCSSSVFCGKWDLVVLCEFARNTDVE